MKLTKNLKEIYESAETENSVIRNEVFGTDGDDGTNKEEQAQAGASK